MIRVQQGIRWWRRNGLMGPWLLFVVIAAVGKTAGGGVESVLMEPEFVQAYDAYYAGLDSYGVEILTAELSDIVEDALISGSRIRTTSLRYKVRHFEDVVYKALAHRLCPAQGSAHATRDKLMPETLKRAAVASIGPASADVGVSMSPQFYGRISALLVRVLESTQQVRFCSSTSFQSLSG